MTALAIFTSLTVQARSPRSEPSPASFSPLSFSFSSTPSSLRRPLRARPRPRSRPRPPPHLSPRHRLLLALPRRRRDLSKAARGACKREEKNLGTGKREAAGGGGGYGGTARGPRDAQSRINAGAARRARGSAWHWYGAVRRDVVRCDAMRCDVARRGAARHVRDRPITTAGASKPHG